MGELTGSLIPSKSWCAFSDGYLAAKDSQTGADVKICEEIAGR
jgi:hypothetical protein